MFHPSYITMSVLGHTEYVQCVADTALARLQYVRYTYLEWMLYGCTYTAGVDATRQAVCVCVCVCECTVSQ